MRRLQMLLGVMAVSMCLVPGASGAIRLTLSSGGTTINIDDQAVGDANGASGAVTFIGAIGNWNINVTTGTVGVNPLIDLNSINRVTGSGTGVNALTLTFSATDYNGPLGFGFDSQIGGTLGGGHSLTYQAYYNPNNAVGATQNAIGSLQSFGPGGAFAGNTTGQTVGAGNYSLTQVVVLSGAVNGGSSFDAAVNVTPEPASVVLLSGVALFIASRMRKQA